MSSRLLSRSCVYAIRAALLLAMKESEDRQVIPIREISEELDIPFHFLTKILHVLTEAGLMSSFRGPNGGVGLAMPARRIRLIDVVIAIDGMEAFESCVLGLPGCGEQRPCPLHDEWVRKRSQILKMFERKTLASVTRNVKGLRL